VFVFVFLFIFIFYDSRSTDPVEVDLLVVNFFFSFVALHILFFFVFL
jgi:hypothetical protein